MTTNYYDELIEKIKELIKNKKNQEALAIVKEELSLPYVPKIYEEQLNIFLEQLDEKETKKRTYFSREEIITIINEYQKHDVDFVINVCNEMEQYNWKGFELELEKIFNIKDLDNKIKSMIYNILVVQSMSYDFKIANYVINPIKNKTMFETQFALKNLVDLSSKKMDDPSIFDVCEKIFFLYLMNRFPESMFFEYKDITNEIINIANVMLGIKKSNELSTEEKIIFDHINAK